jgi:hypothetical protein
MNSSTYKYDINEPVCGKAWSIMSKYSSAPLFALREPGHGNVGAQVVREQRQAIVALALELSFLERAQDVPGLL